MPRSRSAPRRAWNWLWQPSTDLWTSEVFKTSEVWVSRRQSSSVRSALEASTATRTCNRPLSLYLSPM